VIALARPEPRWADVADRPFFRKALETHDLVGADFERDPSTGETNVTLAYPVLTGGGEVDCVLFAVVDFGWFKEFAAAAGLPAGSSVVTTNSWQPASGDCAWCWTRSSGASSSAPRTC